MAKIQISKSDYELTHSLEQYLLELEEELGKVVASELSFKVVTTVLRNLVCEQKKRGGRQEGLLWRICKKLKVSDMMDLENDFMIPKIGGVVNPPKLYFFPLKMSDPESQKSNRYSIRSVIKNWHGVYISGRKITYQKLIKDLSQQMGIAHENDSIDEYLYLLDETRLHNYPIYVYVIYPIGKLVLKLGKSVIDYAENNSGYQRVNEPYKNKSGQASIMIRLGLQTKIRTEETVAEFTSHISRIKIVFSLLEDRMRFQIYSFGDISCNYNSTQKEKKGLSKVYYLDAEYPNNIKFNEDFVCSLSYSAEHKQARILVNDKATMPIELDLGYITLVDLKPKPVRNSKNFYLQFLLAFRGICSKKNNNGLLSLTPEDTLLSNSVKRLNYQNPFIDID